MTDSVQLIKERLSIVDVVSPYVKLTRAGKYWKGLSPFTKEKTASFFVSPDRGLYHCFSTGKGGDIFTFIQEMEGLDFRGSLHYLAEKAGVELVPEKPGERGIREKVLESLELARTFFVQKLSERADARQYLVQRGLTEASISQWSIGYAPNDWKALKDHLIERGMTESILEEAGLIKRRDEETSKGNGTYDRFRGRIMFPIKDISGRTIAFSGRIFEDDPQHPQAKYLNSPETSVFDKSRALYGIDKAKDGIRALNASLLVEGQMDLILAHQAGYRNAVATSGTACTTQHLELLKRYSPNLLISYDGDRAGISAAGRAAALALPMGMNVKVAALPPGMDPADLIQTDASRYKDAVKNAVHVVDFYLAHIRDAKYDTRTFRLEVSRTVVPYIAMIPNTIDQAHFVKRVAESLGIPDEAVLTEVKKLRQGPAPVTSEESVAQPFLSRADSLERLVVGLYFAFAGEDSAAQAECKENLEASVGVERARALLQSEGDESRAALFEADIFLESHPDLEDRARSIRDVYADLKKESLHERYRESTVLLRAAESNGDIGEVDRLMTELNSLAIQLR